MKSIGLLRANPGGWGPVRGPVKLELPVTKGPSREERGSSASGAVCRPLRAASREFRCRRSHARGMLAVAAGLVLVAACGPSAPTVPPGGAELAFTQSAIGVRDIPELGAHAFWTTDDGELREAWSDPDPRSQTASDDLSMPTGQVAVVLDVDHTHHGTEVAHVAEVDDGWLGCGAVRKCGSRTRRAFSADASC